MEIVARLPKELQFYVYEFGAKPDRETRNRAIAELKLNHARIRANIIRIHHIYTLLEVTSVENYCSVQEIIESLRMCRCCTRHMHERRLGRHSTARCPCPCRHMRRWIQSLM